jgi:hypothetical protein
MIEFCGICRWSFDDHESITRKLFSNRKREIFVSQPVTELDEPREGSGLIEIKVGTEEKRQAEGMTNLLRALPEELRPELGDNARTSIFTTPTAFPSIRSFVLPNHWQSDKTKVNRSGPNPSFKEEDFQVTAYRELFDLLVLQRPLNTAPRPLVVLRQAANHLNWGGWLVLICTTFRDPKPGTNWAQSISAMSIDDEMILSHSALIDLMEVSGFTPRSLSGLPKQQLETFALKPIQISAWARSLRKHLFRGITKNSGNRKFHHGSKKVAKSFS